MYSGFGWRRFCTNLAGFQATVWPNVVVGWFVPFFVEEFLMVLVKTLKCAVIAVAVVVAGTAVASAADFEARFNDGTASGFTQDAGQADISSGLTDAQVGQRWFWNSPSAVHIPNGSQKPWAQTKTPASGDGALALGFGYPGKASNHTKLGIGTYTWETEHERFYPSVFPGHETAPAGNSTSPMEKRLEFIVLSNSETGDTNAAGTGLKLSFGAGADQGWQLFQMDSGAPGGKSLLASYHCGGGETAGVNCSANSYRWWHDGSVPTDDDKLKGAHELVIARDGAGGYEAQYSYGNTADSLTLQVSGVDVTAAVNAAGGEGYINFQTHDSGVGRWDNITYTIPEPSSLVLVCLSGLGLLIRRKR